MPKVALLAAALLSFLLLPAAAQPAPDNCPLNFTATGHADGSVTFHWTGFGGAEGYQIFGHAGLANSAGYSPVLSADTRDYTRTDLAAGNYTFWVVAYHSDTLVSSSCQRTTTLGSTAEVPFFTSWLAGGLALVAAIAVVLVIQRRQP